MNLMHSSTASLLCESSPTTGAYCCRLLLFLAGVQSGEGAGADVFLADDAGRNALTTTLLARR
uniref:Uncharacterized protein n=1 Tax=Arundo donax TaxID=35708 RepID=A0A0A9GEW2_ARUDO